jgi:hypothetical protein
VDPRHAIVGILGLASVVVAKDAVEGLSQWWRGGAFGLVAVAVLVAAIATALVYRAAFGWPKEVALGTDEQLLAAAEEITKRNSRIAGGVRVGVSLSFVSLVALLGALAIFWLQPDSTGLMKVTYTEEGDEVSVCGEVARVEDGELVLKVADGPRSMPDRVTLSRVANLGLVRTCGG